MTTSTQSFPQFAGLKRVSLTFVRPAAPIVQRYSRLSTNISSDLRAKFWKEKPASPVRFTQVEYTWNSSIPEKWKKLSKRQFVNRREKAEISSVQFLSATQKFIQWMRRPEDQKPVRRVVRKSCQPVTPVDVSKSEPLGLTYAFHYMGDMAGDLGAMSIKVPVTRPNTTQSKSFHALERKSLDKPQRPQSHLSAIFPSNTSEPLFSRSISVMVTKKGSMCMIENQTDQTQTKVAGKDRETRSRRTQLSDMSQESQRSKPNFPMGKTEGSPFEIWLNGAGERPPRRQKKGKKIVNLLK